MTEGPMGGRNLTYLFVVDQTPKEAYVVINNVRGWWSGNVEGPTDKLGAEWTYRYQDLHYSKQKITDLVPGKKVAWLVVDSYLKFVKDKTEWNGTRITFELTKKGDKTEDPVHPRWSRYGARVLWCMFGRMGLLHQGKLAKSDGPGCWPAESEGEEDSKVMRLLGLKSSTGFYSAPALKLPVRHLVRRKGDLFEGVEHSRPGRFPPSNGSPRTLFVDGVSTPHYCSLIRKGNTGECITPP